MYYVVIVFKTVFRIRISFHADPDPGSQKCPYGSGSGSTSLIFYSDPDPKGVKMKEYQQIFNKIYQNDTKTLLKISKHKVLQRILTFMFPVLYTPNEPVYFLDFFTSWIRIQESYLYADPCGSGYKTLI